MVIELGVQCYLIRFRLQYSLVRVCLEGKRVSYMSFGNVVAKGSKRCMNAIQLKESEIMKLNVTTIRASWNIV